MTGKIETLKWFLNWIIIMLLNIIKMFFFIFPIRQNRILFNSYGGRKYACNPKYISDGLIENFKDKYEIIWVFRDVKKYLNLKKFGIKLVPYMSLRYIFYEATAHVSITNMGIVLRQRKGQEHINTWHGGGAYKSTGLEEKGKNWFSAQRYKNNAKNTTLFLSTSKYFAKFVLPKDFDYYGKVLECGFPRNDMLVRCNEQKRNKISQKIRSQLHISDEIGLILYAPTWRYNTKDNLPDIAIEAVTEAYEKRFQKKAAFLYRAHHLTNVSGIETAINVTDYPDMQELLLVCDMLITDYSSSIWDFSFTYKPCILYTPDVEQYRKERGLIRDISEWHFPYFTDNESMIQYIENFNEEEFIAGMKQHHEDLGSCETGEACKRVCEYIYNVCFGGNDGERI